MTDVAMTNLRGGLVGCGFFAINQLHGWRDVAGAEIVALCDSNAGRLAQVGAEFGISRLYTDAAEMFAAEKLDFVDIATTVPSHKALVELAAAHHLPVICQKPFALNLSDAKAMVAACAAANVPLMVHENFRWQSPIQAARAALSEIGDVFWGRVSFRSNYDVFSGQPYLATGARFIIEDLGIHALDVARFLFGDVSSLSARTKRVNPKIRGEDVATILLDHISGVTSVVDCSYATQLEEELFPQTLIEADGANGSVRLNKNYQLVVTVNGVSTRRDVSPKLLPWAQKPWHNIQESVLLIQQHWAECLRGGQEPQTSGRDNLQTFVLVEAAYSSAASGQKIEMSAFMEQG